MNAAIKTGLCAVLACCSGCASIVTGPRSTVRVKTDPPGATVRAGSFKATTPAKLNLDTTGAEFNGTLVISMPGYKTQVVDLSPESNPWIWGNIPLGGLVVTPLYMVFDSATGAAVKWKPADVELLLVPGITATNHPNGIVPMLSETAKTLRSVHVPPSKCRITILCPGARAVVTRVEDTGSSIGMLRNRHFMTWERDAGRVQLNVTRWQPYEFQAKAGSHYFFQVKQSLSKVVPLAGNEAHPLIDECKPTPRHSYVLFKDET